MTAAPLLPTIRIDQRPPSAEARAFLERDRLLAAYALADLDPQSGDSARWWLARRDAEPVACVLLVDTLPFRPCFATGESEGVAAILRDALREPRLIVATPTESRLAVETVYRFERAEAMHRMAVDARTFRPRITHPLVRLGPDRLDDVIDLYGQASSTYFTAARLARELYFGSYSGATLVSAAGTHVRSARSGIAAVGNVLTRLGARGRGLATSCTAAVTEAALAEHRDVVLNVRQENAAAIAVYARLGYRVHAPFIEGPAARRAPWDRLGKILGRRDS
ncbi:hypothetical protein BH18CHL2_BH18CHL2_02150 [soil metagenome]